MPTDIADVIKDINKRLIAAERQIFGFTQLIHALVASNSVSTVILREHIELLRSRLECRPTQLMRLRHCILRQPGI